MKRSLYFPAILLFGILAGCKKEPVPPTLTTTAVTDVTYSTAKSGGRITDDGDAAVTDQGVCWSTSPDPTTADNYGSSGSGSVNFTYDLADLTEGTEYFVRAYATNKAGTAYGNELSFTTLLSTTASVTTRAVTAITSESASSGGDIVNDGGAQITAKGICWNTSENPTLENNHTTDGTGTDGFVSNITGLEDGTTYYVRAYATNNKGTAYGNQQTFSTSATIATVTTRAVTEVTSATAISGGDISDDGGAAITAKGICWNTSENPTIENNHTTDGAGTEGFASSMTGLTNGTTYYVRAYATNSQGTAYGAQQTFTTTPATMATLTTAAITGLTINSGITGGNISNNGGSEITERGVCWSTSPTPLITHNKTSDGTGIGSYVSNITGLEAGTLYYVRSFATNSAGTSYGNELSFTTPVMDIEGNLYRTVAIGNQIWMAENLKTTRYNNNTAIPNVVDSLAWMAQNTLQTPAYVWYRNNISNKDTYGALYNWFTVATGNLCPQGWHVPTQTEYKAMESHIGVPADSLDYFGWRGVGKGTNLKSTTGWVGGNGDNLSGLTVLPAGYRAWNNAEFRALGTITYLWTATNDAANMKPNVAWYRRLDSPDTRIYNATTERGSGKSVRCVKNQ